MNCTSPPRCGTLPHCGVLARGRKTGLTFLSRFLRRKRVRPSVLRRTGYTVTGLQGVSAPTAMNTFTDTDHGRSRLTSRVESSLVWLLGHVSTLAPFLIFGLLLALSW